MSRDKKGDDGRDCKLGYGKPPINSRFRKGQSGNPKGRTAGRRNLKTELLDELGNRVPVAENGRRRLLSKQTVIVKRMVADAAKGDARAREQLLRLIGQMDPVGDSSKVSTPSAAEDAEILTRFRSRLLDEIKAKQEDH